MNVTRKLNTPTYEMEIPSTGEKILSIDHF